MKQKKKSDVAILMDYAGSHRILTYIGLILSAISMILSMIPYVCIWLVARDLIAVAPNWSQAEMITQYGWIAFASAVGGILIYSAAMFQNGNRCGFDRWKGTPFSRGPFLLFTVAKDLKVILSQGTTSYFRLLQKRRHLLHMGGYFQTLGTVGSTRAAADTGGGLFIHRQGVQPGQTPGGQVLFSPGLILVESSEQEGNVQLLGAVGAAVAAARAGHRIETVDHVAHLPHQSNLLFRQRLVVGEGLDIVFYLLQRGHPA